MRVVVGGVRVRWWVLRWGWRRSRRMSGLLGGCRTSRMPSALTLD